jgi:hypothetical protein
MTRKDGCSGKRLAKECCIQKLFLSSTTSSRLSMSTLTTGTRQSLSLMWSHNQWSTREVESFLATSVQRSSMCYRTLAMSSDLNLFVVLGGFVSSTCVQNVSSPFLSGKRKMGLALARDPKASTSSVPSSLCSSSGDPCSHPSSSASKSVMVTLDIITQKITPRTGVLGRVTHRRPPRTGVFGRVRKWPVRSRLHRSGPGGLTCAILCSNLGCSSSTTNPVSDSLHHTNFRGTIEPKFC